MELLLVVLVPELSAPVDVVPEDVVLVLLDVVEPPALV